MPDSPVGSGLARALRDALRLVSGMKVTDADAQDVACRLRGLGVEIIYTSQVEQWGEMANCCVYQETGKKCPFCQCGGKNMRPGPIS